MSPHWFGIADLGLEGQHRSIKALIIDDVSPGYGEEVDDTGSDIDQGSERDEVGCFYPDDREDMGDPREAQGRR